MFRKRQSKEEEQSELTLSRIRERVPNDNDDPNFDRKLDLITSGAKAHVREHLLTKITRENCRIIVDYVLALPTEVSSSENYRIDTISKLKASRTYEISIASTYAACIVCSSPFRGCW